ncbi:MAG TPA: hypothetical protein VEJ18_12835, partial [Planctomycetota bacterium]|nr:hypothetical protein [Planctomycetota bacterium]
RPATWQAPGDGRFAFRIVPTVRGQREFTPTSGDAPDWAAVVDTRPPVVELLAPNGGEIFGARRATIVSWVAQDAHAAPAGVVLEASSSDEEGWVVVAKDLPNTGRYHWELPATSSQSWRLRVLVRDLAGNVGQDASDRPFAIDGLAPDLKILGPKTAVQAPVAIEVQAADLGGAGLRKLALWATRDGGQTWSSAGEDEDLRSPILFQDLDGIYGLRLSAEDRVGNVAAPPRPGTPPQAMLILDRAAPEVKLLAPTAGGLLAGVPTSVRWTATDNVEMPPTGIAVHFSADGGKTWSEVAGGLQNDGEYTWTPPEDPAADCRLKVVATDAAGNKGEAASGRFGLDGGIPEARATGPDRVGSHSAKIHYEIRGRGTAPVVQVTLWYKPENVKEWLKYGDDPDAESPMLFAKADGRYGIYVTCATDAGLKAGRVQPAPDADTQPQMTVTVDATPPQVTLETFAGGGYFASGASQEILWKLLEENPDPRGMLIHHSPDGGASWNLITSGADPVSGKHRWVVPPSPGARHKIRLTVADRFGNRSETESEKPFTIDAEIPSVLVLEKPASATRSPRIQVRYKAADTTSGVEKVVLHARPANDEKAPYKPLAENRAAEGTFDVQAPGEGAWAFLVVAVDGAGLMSADTGRIVRADFVVGFDATAPEVVLKAAMLPDGTTSVLTPSWELEWTAKDDATAGDRLSIRLELSTDAGRTWGVAVAKHPNTGKADLRSFLQPGKRYRARVVAVDEAGNEGEAVSSDFDPQDVPPAALSILGIEDGRAYPVGSVVTVAWASPDRTIREATLEISTDGGRTWAPYAEMRTASMRVTLPAKEGRYHLRAMARDFTRRPI